MRTEKASEKKEKNGWNEMLIKFSKCGIEFRTQKKRNKKTTTQTYQ